MDECRAHNPDDGDSIAPPATTNNVDRQSLEHLGLVMAYLSLVSRVRIPAIDTRMTTGR